MILVKVEEICLLLYVFLVYVNELWMNRRERRLRGFKTWREPVIYQSNACLFLLKGELLEDAGACLAGEGLSERMQQLYRLSKTANKIKGGGGEEKINQWKYWSIPKTSRLLLCWMTSNTEHSKPLSVSFVNWYVVLAWKRWDAVWLELRLLSILPELWQGATGLHRMMSGGHWCQRGARLFFQNTWVSVLQKKCPSYIHQTFCWNSLQTVWEIVSIFTHFDYKSIFAWQSKLSIYSFLFCTTYVMIVCVWACVCVCMCMCLCAYVCLCVWIQEMCIYASRCVIRKKHWLSHIATASLPLP